VGAGVKIERVRNRFSLCKANKNEERGKKERKKGKRKKGERKKEEKGRRRVL